MSVFTDYSRKRLTHQLKRRLLITTYCYSDYMNEAGNGVNLTGVASIAYEKERQANADGIVTPERVRQTLIM